MKKLVRESPTWAISVERSVAIAGNPGKYMSTEKGPIAERAPRTDIMTRYCLLPIAGFGSSGKTREMEEFFRLRFFSRDNTGASPFPELTRIDMTKVRNRRYFAGVCTINS